MEVNTIIERPESYDQSNYIFVYGTLRHGNTNNNLLITNRATYIGEFKTANKYTMYATKSYPYILPDSSGTNIIGEVYYINDKLLTQLDRLEGHPQQYTRITTYVYNATNTLNVYVYVCINPSLQCEIMNSPRFFKITSGDWNTCHKN
jgi:gamma-glutamylcyclotransferase (GGCT)/AIG2-like uncharacterized protein YtfP